MSNVVNFPNQSEQQLFELYSDLADAILYNAGPSLTVMIFASALEKLAQHTENPERSQTLIRANQALASVSEQLSDVYASTGEAKAL